MNPRNKNKANKGPLICAFLPRKLRGRHSYITWESARRIKGRRANIPIRCTITRQVPRFGISAGTGVRQRPLRCLPSGSIAGGGARSPSQAFITSDSNGDLGSPTSVFQIWSRLRVQLKIIFTSVQEGNP